MEAASFLQSPEWEAFQRSLGRRTWRAGGILVIRHDVPLGLNYLYCPRPDARITDLVSRSTELRDIAAAEKSIFLKIDPAGDLRLRDTGYAFSEARPLQPRETIILDLDKSEEELLAGMHEKTRYNIRLAERKGVRIKNQESRIKNFVVFCRLLWETAKRDGFSTHPREYYEKLVAVHSENFSNELFFAEYSGKIIAAALVNFYRSETSIGATATYLHGASSREYKEAMAPQLLHWRAIEEARRRGFHSYDFWGIDARRWPGLTRFKQGFGGAVAAYPPSIEIGCRPVGFAMYRLWKRFWQK